METYFNLLPNENVFHVGGETLRLSALDEYTVCGDTLLQYLSCCEEMDNDQWRMDLILGVAMDPDAEGTHHWFNCKL